ncbi:MAG: hypothetical protein ACXWUG_03440 [Polyangiales bacterium]
MSSLRRSWTPVEAAIAFAVVFGALAATVPSCIRAVRLTKTAEAAENLEKLAQASALYLSQKQAAPLVATPLTPAAVPRGTTVEDQPGTWDHPTWKALAFSIEEPHAYAYRVDVDVDPLTPVRVVAHGDLDGDGVLSTFERSLVRDGKGVAPRPGLVVSSDLE